MEQETYGRIYPPDDIYQNPPLDTTEQVVKHRHVSYIFDHAEYPESGGVFVHYKDVPYPEKCFPDFRKMWFVNTAKRILMDLVLSLATKELILPGLVFLFLPFKTKVKFLEKFLLQHNRLLEWILFPCYLQDIRYCVFGQETRKMLNGFLTELGVDASISDRFAKAFITLIENDNAYRYRVQDLFSSTTKERMLNSPRGEIKRMIQLAKDRDDGYTETKFIAFANLLSFALWLPKVKQAFRNSLLKVEFEKLQLDEADKYHCLRRVDYKFFGMSWEQRKEIYEKFHNGVFPPQLIVVPKN